MYITSRLHSGTDRGQVAQVGERRSARAGKRRGKARRVGGGGALPIGPFFCKIFLCPAPHCVLSGTME